MELNGTAGSGLSEPLLPLAQGEPPSADDKWVTSIREKIDQAKEEEAARPWAEHSIYRVPNTLREVDEKAYVPQLVSLGPYHHGRHPDMEPHKWRALHMVLRRTGHDIEHYLCHMGHLKDEALACYEGSVGLTGKQFIEMMILDGTFVLELFRGVVDEGRAFEHELGYMRNDPVFSLRGTMHFRRDMIMLENQIPLFVLDRLHSLQTGEPERAGRVAVRAVEFFDPLMPTNEPLRTGDRGPLPGLHCLDVFRRSMLTSVATPGSHDELAINLSSLVIPQLSGSPAGTLSPDPPPLECLITPGSPTEPDPVSEPDASLSPTESDAGCPIDLRSDTVHHAALDPDRRASIIPDGPHPAPTSTMITPGSPPPEPRPAPPPREAVVPPVLLIDPAFVEITPLAMIMRSPPTWTRPARVSLMKRLWSRGLHCLEAFRQSLLRMPRNEGIDKGRHQKIHCVSELVEAGIKFRKRKTDRFWDIEFSRGVLKIPPLLIQDGTKSLLLNLIAFEQRRMDRGHDITSYVVFMDDLINSDDDVRHLHYHGIIEHWQGNDGEAADLFNHLCREVVFDINDSYLSGVSDRVNRYYGHRWNGWRASLAHNYFGNPWAIISLFAALVLLLLTVAQTFYAVYSYYRPSS